MHAGGVGPPRGGVIYLTAAGLPAPPNTAEIAIQTTHEAATEVRRVFARDGYVCIEVRAAYQPGDVHRVRLLDVEWANELSSDPPTRPDEPTTS